MQITEMFVKDLVPYDKNPRDNKEAVQYVANSIKEFGFKNPILVDADNVIIAGHTRLLAAKKLKMKKVPVIVCSDLPPEKVKALRLADNKVSEFSVWDDDLLAKELEELADFEGLDMLDFGFDLGDDDFEEEKPAKEPKEVDTDSEYCIIVECDTEEELQQAFEQLTEDGYKCRISTL